MAWLVALVVAGLSAGVSYAAAPPGSMLAFGYNEYGQLGSATNNGTANPNPTPVTLPGQVGQVTQVAAGEFHSLVVTSGGQLYAFGQNLYGQLGSATNSGTGNPNPTPMLVTLPGQVGQVTQVAAGEFHSLVVTSSGQLYGFGHNQYGELGSATNNGTGNANPTPAPVVLPGQVGHVIQIAAGAGHSLVLTSSGQLYGFGYNYYGELGSAANNGTAKANPTPTPVTLPGQVGKVTQVAAGVFHSLVATSSGQLYGFGDNSGGELGSATNNGTGNPNPTPTFVTLPGRVGSVTQVAAGGDHSLVVTSSGQLYGFGFNGYGELGSATNNGTNNPNPTPVLVTLPGEVGKVAQVAAGEAHSLVVTSSGQLYAFGVNVYGQLGSATHAGTPTANPTPSLVSLGAGRTVATIARGAYAFHSLIVLAPPPALSGLGQAHRVWRAGIHGVKLTPTQRRVPIGTRFVFTLNTPATVRLAFARRLPGRLVRGRCVPGTGANRTRRSCIRTILAGQIAVNAAVGPGGVAFTGRLGRARRLPPGNYVVAVTAVASQLTTAAQTLRFTIARG